MKSPVDAFLFAMDVIEQRTPAAACYAECPSRRTRRAQDCDCAERAIRPEPGEGFDEGGES